MTCGGEKDIHRYTADWNIFSMAWCNRVDPSYKFRLAIGSLIPDGQNTVQIIQCANDTTQFIPVAQFNHSYPATKILWAPPSYERQSLLATTGDFLRIWSISPETSEGVKLEALLNNNKTSEYCAPLTSFDWNETNPSIIATSSIDTTCTIWDITTQQAKTQLIAHDKEVYDIAFSKQEDIFASVGADGSVRLFDLRSLEHSTIIYETQNLVPLLRLEWNKQDPNYLATFMTDSDKIIILDIRAPSIPVCELVRHQAFVNAIAWAPHSPFNICSCGEDSQALIWNLKRDNETVESIIRDPILAYTAPAEINQVQWVAPYSDWIGIAYKNQVEVLHV